MAAHVRAIARLIRAFRSRSNLRPAALFSLGAVVVLLGIKYGMSNIASSALAAWLIIAGVALGAVAVAMIMLRPDAANDN
ncbi:hypothetical protein D3C72_281380 [compost metagenome]